MAESQLNAGPPAADVIVVRPFPQPPNSWTPQRLGLAAVPRRSAALDLVLLIVVALVVPFGFELAAQLAVGNPPEIGFDAHVLVLRKWFDALLLVVLAGYFVCRNRISAVAFGLRIDHLGRQGLWGGATLLAAYAAFLPAVLVVLVLVTTYPEYQQDLVHRARFIQALPLNDLTTILLLLVPVAIHEELLFCALLIPYLHRMGCGWPVAVLISSTIFAALHVTQGWLGVAQIFGVGVALGLFFVLSRSALAVICAHFLFDLIQTLLARFLLPWIEQFTPPT